MVSVLHLSTAQTWRGGEQQLYYLFHELNKLGLNQHLFAVEHGAIAERIDSEGFPVISFKKSFSLNPFLASKLAQTVRRLDVDILHVHDSHAHSIAVLASSFFGLKQAIVLHRRVDFQPKKQALKLWKYNHSAIAKIICISQKIASGLSPLIRDENKLLTIHSCVNPERFARSEKGKLRDELGLGADIPIVANIAALTPEKDYPTWLKAAALINQQRPDIHFVALGSGDSGLKELMRLSNQLNISSKVHFLGHRSDLPDLMSDIDLLMFSSKKEGLGTSILDAFCCNIPVVATKTGGIPELVIHEQTGFLTTVGNSRELASLSLKILNDPGLQKKITFNAKQHLQSFTCSHMARQVREVYDNVLVI